MRTINYAGYRMVRGFRSIIYKSNGEIHYISGTDVLPVPLEGEEEKNAIAMLATEAEREHGRNILIEHNLKLISRADWLVDMGPDAGKFGGQVCFEGHPKDSLNDKNSRTGAALAAIIS